MVLFFQYFVFILSGINHVGRLLSMSLKDLVNNLDFMIVLLLKQYNLLGT